MRLTSLASENVEVVTASHININSRRKETPF
jgi:hypothetical protein